MPVLVGTSGWSYDDWEGFVYPRGTPAGERLATYALRFPTVEIDSTYYRDPAPGVVRGWIEKTRDVAAVTEGSEDKRRFEFSVKVPKALTHEALVDASSEEIARIARAWRVLVADSLAEAKRLGAILLQLSPAIYRRGSALERLDVALSELKPHLAAVEFRNHTWHDGAGALDPDTVALLDAHNAAAVLVDGPPFPPIVAGAAGHAFIRFHGRNAERWRRSERSERGPRRAGRVEDKQDTYYGARYDYLYQAAELDPWAKRIAALAREKRDVRVYFNNHVQGKSFRNGELFESLLEREVAPLVRASAAQRRLF